MCIKFCVDSRIFTNLLSTLIQNQQDIKWTIHLNSNSTAIELLSYSIGNDDEFKEPEVM